jgi:hypothetical protein
MTWFTRATPIAPFVAVIGGVPLLVALYVRARLLRYYDRASWLVDNVPPVSRTATFRLANFNRPRRRRHYYVTVAAGPGVQVPVEYLIVPPDWDALNEEKVQAYYDPEPHGPIVLRAERGLVWPHPSTTWRGLTR